MSAPLIFHIDVNSAFLSWEASYRVNTLGEEEDLRLIPSAVGGDIERRHGIVLAKSTPAKKYKITTGEPLVNALKKCPNLVIVPPNFDLYVKCSSELMKLLKEYAPEVEQYSIDEAFCNMTGTSMLYGSPVEFANKLKDIIKNELKFTVNIGISSNKILAKMASDFEKPDKVHTLFPNEISTKLWPLPVEDLFYVGRSTAQKLRKLGISTIGELADTDPEILRFHFKKHGEVIYNYANGIDNTPFEREPVKNKGYGNSITLSADLTDAKIAKQIILSLCETVAARIRADKAYIGVVSVSIVNFEFSHSSRQITLDSPTKVTEKIYETACMLFDNLWDNTPIRLLGVSTSHATDTAFEQYNMFDMDRFEKLSKLNNAIDSIRNKYGEDSVQRASFINSKQTHMTGGINKSKRNKRD